jgi:Ca2+-binding EF-hand superfamily protein
MNVPLFLEAIDSSKDTVF